MATIKTIIELDEKDLQIILCDHFKIKDEGATISVYKFEGDHRDPSYTKITLTGIKV